MATYGFYFGYTFGLMKVILAVLSMIIAVLSAMAFTPMTTNLIIDTFHVESPFLPFVAFLITLLVVLMMARIFTKFIEETVDDKKFNTTSQFVGGFLMSLIFTMLYSVLVTFFGQAQVIDLVFNEDIMITKENKDMHLGILKGPIGHPDLITLHIKGEDTTYRFDGTGELRFGSDPRGDGTYRSYLSCADREFAFMPRDTFYLKSKRQMYIKEGRKVLCFCDSTFLIEAQNDTIYFQCTDKYFSSQSPTSFFYRYIELIPKRGRLLMEGMIPFVQHFLNYMDIALERLEKGRKKPKKPINVYSEDDNKTTTHPEIEDEFTEEDSIQYSIDTTNIPSISPDTIDTK